MSMILDGTNGATFNDGSLQAAAASPYVLKNRIINGAMVIDQRNAGVSVTPTSDTYTLDRWSAFLNQASKFSVQRSTTAPTGFSFSALITSTSAYSVTSGDLFAFGQYIEGFNTADLMWGTANAQTITLSFWVRSSLTGTFGGAIRNNAANRSYPFSYTISAANTWEQKSITIAGDTSGTWVGATNGTGLQLFFGLGVGSTFSGTAGSWNGNNNLSATGATSVVGTNGATWYITGVQLEVGSTATPFERRLFTTELTLCQRYYETNVSIGTAVGNNKYVADRQYIIAYSSGAAGFNVTYVVPKRASPTLTAYSGTNSSGSNNELTYYTGSSWTQVTSTTLSSTSASETTSFQYDVTKSAAFTTSSAYICQPVWSANAEL